MTIPHFILIPIIANDLSKLFRLVEMKDVYYNFFHRKLIQGFSINILKMLLIHFINIQQVYNNIMYCFSNLEPITQ